MTVFFYDSSINSLNNFLTKIFILKNKLTIIKNKAIMKIDK